MKPAALDRNKSDDTHVATATCAAWLDYLGCKPVETEVAVGGWIADLATFWSPTMTEAKQSKLMKFIVPPAILHKCREAYGWIGRQYPGRLTVAVEIKVSRSDFLRDVGVKIGTYQKRATLHPPAHLCVLAAPSGVKLETEHLHNWAFLELSKDCTRVRKFHGGWHVNAVHQWQIEELIAQVAIRRDHNTRYESHRRMWRAYRLRAAEDRAHWKAYRAKMETAQEQETSA